MISSRGKDVQAKQEGDSSGKFSRPQVAETTSSRQWSAFRNPRIVRVSRSFGGKDRHSKVCTIRGLRDRRIRLSVPTAIQLYDLQDRLGLTQPSKVVDWLLDVTKDDIDKLPPLQIPHGFAQFHQPMLASHHELGSGSASHLAPFLDANPTFMKDVGFHSLGIKINNGGFEGQDQVKSKYNWDADSSLRSRSGKEVEAIMEKGKWIKTNEQQNQEGGVCNDNYNSMGAQVSAQNFFPLATTTPSSSLPSLLNNSLPLNPYFHWDAPNLSLSQFGAQGFVPQSENSSTSQLFFCPPTTIPSFFQQFPPYATAAPAENTESREINHFQLSTSRGIMTSPMKHFSLNINPALAHAHQTNNEGHPDDHKDT